MKDEQPPIASVVIANWNGLRWMRRVLPCLREQRFRDFEVVVVDNGSTDGSVEFLRREHPEVVLLPLDCNTGFAGGSNAGIRASRGRYVVLLNNDTAPEPEWLGALVRAAEADPQVGMCAPLIFDADAADRLDSAGIGVWYDGFSRQMRHGEPPPRGMALQECLIPSGCAGLYRRSMLDEIGLLDEDFFCYCEDTDLGLRGRFAGWKCLLCPEARVHHYYSQSGGRDVARKIFWVERNHYYVAIKNFPWFLLAALPATSACRLGLQLIGMLHGRARGLSARGRLTVRGAAGAMAGAYVSLLGNAPAMWSKRRALRRTRRLTGGQCLALIRRYRADVRYAIFN